MTGTAAIIPTATAATAAPTDTRTAGATPTQTQVIPSATFTATATFTLTQAAPTATYTPTQIPATATTAPTAPAATYTPTQIPTPPTTAPTATAVDTPVFTSTPTQQPPTATATIALTQTTGPIVYPNPSSDGHIKIRFNAANPADDLKIAIYTKAFRLVRYIDIPAVYKEGINEVDLGVQYMMDFSKGSYIFKLMLKDNSGQTETSKIGTFIIM